MATRKPATTRSTAKSTTTARKPAARKSATAANAAPAGARGNGAQKVVMKLDHNQIAAKAYEIWLAKGRPTGQDEQNWREAEALLQSNAA